jgi:Fur family transcriptional regulator, peroxide stress response regulator
MSLPDFLDRCRARGVKATPQRIAIFECLQARGGHLTAEEVYEEVSQRQPTISFATVYNTLELLCELGEVRPVIVDELRRRYDVNPRAHQHAVCQRCHGIVDVDVAPEAVLRAILPLVDAEQIDFRIEGAAVKFYGLCSTCADAPESAP